MIKILECFVLLLLQPLNGLVLLLYFPLAYLFDADEDVGPDVACTVYFHVADGAIRLYALNKLKFGGEIIDVSRVRLLSEGHDSSVVLIPLLQSQLVMFINVIFEAIFSDCCHDFTCSIVCHLPY